MGAPAGSPWIFLPDAVNDTYTTDGQRAAEQQRREAELAPELLYDLNDPNLVLSSDYIGSDRRATTVTARVRRATFRQRRSLLRLELLVLVVVALVVAAAVLLVGSDRSPSESTSLRTSHPLSRTVPPVETTGTLDRRSTVPTPAVTGGSPAAPTPTPTVAGAVPNPHTAPPAATPAATVPVAAAATPTTTAPPPVADAASLTPQQMGAQALTLVRYPWQSIPGYSIEFLPIAQAPSPDFYGNTTFTWGRAGGTSVLYVYPGETIERLAAITAFEIGHEVDAAAVEPQGGETQIENALGMHPASWAPNCDCAEQNFLSGWYAAAFSNYWSPGVGNWSNIAPEPSGALLAEIEPWLNPSIP